MNKLQALLITGLLSLSSVSFASTFNFAAYADGNAAGSIAITGLGEAGYTSFSATNAIDSLKVTATATDSFGQRAAYAYLDSKAGMPGDAGLGVCSVLDGANQCSPSNDDNVTGGEAVKLTFNHLVSIDGLKLKDANHGIDFSGFFDILVDGTMHNNIALSGAPLEAIGLVGKTFEFFNIGGGVGSQFYVNTISVSAVPVPAAGILFASALFGAGALGRRKKKAKASVVGAFARAS